MSAHGWAAAVYRRVQPAVVVLKRRAPWLGRALAPLGRRVLPLDARVPLRCLGGMAEGFTLFVNPRLEDSYLHAGEDELQAVWRTYLRPGAVFYDVGSHIGVLALGGARLVGADGCVYAFEPDPENVRLIRLHAEVNGVAVEIVPCAAWSESGRVRFLPAADSDPGRMSGAVANVGAGSAVIEVEAVALDDFARAHRRPDFVKIDVEGAEAEVLRGAREILARDRPPLLVEIHHESAGREVARLLAEHRYAVEPVVPGSRLYLALPG